MSRIGGIYRSSAADWHRLFCGDASPVSCSDYRLRDMPLVIRSRATYRAGARDSMMTDGSARRKGMFMTARRTMMVMMVLATARLFSDKGAYGQRAAGEIE